MLPMLENTVGWVLSTLSTTCFNKRILGETLSSKTRALFSSDLPVTWSKSARLVHSCARIGPCWLVSRPNVCAPWPFVAWIVARNRRSTTLLHKHWIISFNVLYTRTLETNKVFGGRTQNLSTFQEFLSFPTSVKDHSFSVVQKVYPVTARMRNKSAQRKTAKY